MTPSRLSECLAALRWSVREAARAFGYPSHTTVRQWLDGRAQVPQHVAAWLERAAKWHERNPPPPRQP